ncbi:hypothetical protein [Thiothrix nivea]|uniref:Uncharacterized protein n=1 Tax=Thiothrix nivea (strain ATCC 35100 / DSM 5205 / JP2) TaxID=870187 RepID=A0A656HDQ0_THINJ|nr:hypothetical protein [Thiothrix nivea]EIJ34537.1 hypothetical protein Thini_1963 [Thiothrix nivea DSM 5205]
MNGNDQANPSGDMLTGNDEWESVATFIVEYQSRCGDEGGKEYQTLITQMDADDEKGISEEAWSGLQEDAPCSWMGGRLSGILRALGLLSREDEHG